MLDVNTISFLGFALLILGLSITAFLDLRVNGQMTNYWRSSLVLIAAGYAFFAASPFVDRFLITFANTCIFTSAITLGLLFRRWRTNISGILKLVCVSLPCIFFFIFEFIRISGTFQQRVLLIMSALSICVIWHIYELTRLQKYESSFFGKLLVAFSALSLICYLTRMIVVTLGSDPANIDLFSESVISYATRWGVMASDVLTFMAINGYYMEKSWASEKNYLSTELINAKKITALNQELINTNQLNSDLSLVLLEKNRLLTSLSSSVKSSRAGIMASAFVHEINQSLTAVRLNAEFLLAVADKPTDAKFFKHNLNYLIKDIDKISEIVLNVKKVFHNNDSEFKDVLLASVVQTCCELVKEECEIKNITLTIDVDSELVVFGSQSQLEMVVLNLLSNSIDSLESFDGMRSIVISSFTENEKINLSVADSGVGVPIESQEKIFELFHTTKNDGMGFGLWLSRAVMENHRGSLFIDKDYPKGARFVIEFCLSNNSM